MQTLKNTIKVDLTKYPFEKLAPLEDQLYFDIETTGFSPANSIIYLIGCAYFRDGAFHSIQFFAEKEIDEELVLYNFFNFAKYFQTLLHYNGNTFDIPFIQAKIQKYDMPFSFDGFNGVDIYRRILPLRSFLNMDNLKQHSVEEFIGFERDDTYSGGELISVYKEFVNNPSEFKRELILQHNYDDLRGMINIVPMLSFCDLLYEDVLVTKVFKNPYKALDGSLKAEIVMHLDLPCEIPVEFSSGYSDCYFTASGKEGRLKVTIFEGELKYFYPNYKEYYYLPAEDMAIHKSVASFVDKSCRETAKAANCYTKKISSFLPQFTPLFKPEFKSDYHNKTTYFELTNDYKKETDKFTVYANHILSVLASN